ncbi:chromophore lyase CpcT/CpeT [Oleiharenicola lentus]|uniref:chromophore lyase CpcT/CpeT n=1 Tax=Oleiharenicola lentus TaxID=2508720 RepID=UPI003F67B3CC
MRSFSRLWLPTILFLVSMNVFANDASPLTKLVGQFAGSFSSAEQARGDHNFQSTVLNIVRFWPDKSDGVWLYAEQALPGGLRHPYKQTVYQLVARDDGSFECRFYDLVDPVAATGGWKNTTIINNFSTNDLRARENCTVILRAESDGSFKGITEGKGCANIRGAAYATTAITVTDKQITLWERGYTANGTQIWGSVHGGYVFKKIE